MPEELARLRRKHIGFIFQSYNLFPTLTALENVRIALDVRGQKGFAAANRAEEVLRDVGLGYRLKNYPGNLSGGEQQRVAVARAIASSPSIVLADEPTAALDGENGHAVMALLGAHRQGAEPQRSGGHARPPHAQLCRSGRAHRRRSDRRRRAPP